MTVKAQIDALVASHPQKEVAIQHLYAQKAVIYTDNPLEPVGPQSRYREAWAAYQQEDEKSQ